ncbi:MAG: hypothetical protein ACQ5SW_13950 [Sphaerochaetaceae bacterium]
MYGIVQKHSTKRMYTSTQDAYRLLAHYYLRITQEGGYILDYLLLPYSIDLLLFFPKARSNLLEVAPTQLLSLFGILGCAGKHYPFSGTYELYHTSHCFCELGKTGTTTLPYSLEAILRVKQKANHVPCLF